jgi:hypothetical protein
MKVLVAMQHANFFRNLETVARELDRRGHETVMLYGGYADDPALDAAAKKTKKKPKMAHMGRGIQVAEQEIGTLSTGPRPDPPERIQQWLKAGRLVVNRALYMRPDHPSPDRVVEGLEKQLPRVVRPYLNSRPARAVLSRKGTLRAWRRLEHAAPASRTLTTLLQEHRPDVVLASPSVWPKNPVEAD